MTFGWERSNWEQSDHGANLHITTKPSLATIMNFCFKKLKKKQLTGAVFKIFIGIYYFRCFRFLVRVSYLEIYNENVRDLLGKDQNAKLEVRCFCS